MLPLRQTTLDNDKNKDFSAKDNEFTWIVKKSFMTSDTGNIKDDYCQLAKGADLT